MSIDLFHRRARIADLVPNVTLFEVNCVTGESADVCSSILVLSKPYASIRTGSIFVNTAIPGRKTMVERSVQDMNAKQHPNQYNFHCWFLEKEHAVEFADWVNSGGLINSDDEWGTLAYDLTRQHRDDFGW